jgi:acetyl esterase/lipase
MTIGRVVMVSLLAVVIVVAGYIAFGSPPAVLDTLNSLTPGDRDARLVARGIDYGAAPRQQLDIWAPKSPHSKPLPVLIFYYGGAWIKGSRQSYGFVGRAYAAKGFVVVIPDYRLVPGVRYPVFLQDSALAVKWVRDNIAKFGGDPKRISVAGHSAGAYNAAMLAVDGKLLSDIGVDPHIIRAAAILAGPLDFYPWDDKRAVAAFANWPRPAETQPIHYAQKDLPPMFLAYGSADKTVKPRNSRDMAAALQKVGAPYVLREYPGKSHNDLVMGLSKPFRGNAPTLAETVAFLKANSR